MECQKCHHEIVKDQEVCLNCGHILGYESTESYPCPHCSRLIPIGINKCPYCKKKLYKSRKKKAIIFTFFILIINLIFLHYLYKAPNERVETNYKELCIPITYEQLLRKAEYYNNYNVYFDGSIIDINTTNKNKKNMEITILVDGKEDEEVLLSFKNIESKGYRVNDIVTVYGNYTSLNGNIPYIKAKYIDIKKANN